MQIVYRALSLVGLAASLTVTGVGSLHFSAGLRATPGDITGNSAAVVFTGAFERVHTGLELLADGITDRLLISGANPAAGMRPQHFAAQFGARHPKLQEMLECCIELGPLAETTLQNALETQCWLERNRIAGAIVLITSAEHMPRALAATRGLVLDLEVLPFPVRAQKDDSPATAARRISEYLKYFATLLLIQMPDFVLSRSGLYGPFADGCPNSHVKTGPELRIVERAAR